MLIDCETENRNNDHPLQILRDEIQNTPNLLIGLFGDKQWELARHRALFGQEVLKALSISKHFKLYLFFHRAREDKLEPMVRMVSKEKEAKPGPKVHLEIEAS